MKEIEIKRTPNLELIIVRFGCSIWIRLVFFLKTKFKEKQRIQIDIFF